jgi:hypothetical protein
VAQVAAGGDGKGETGGTVEWQRPWSERGWHGRRRYLHSVADERGPRDFLFFLNYPNRLKLELDIMNNFCMWLAWDIMNNILNCANIQFPIELYLKILEQIQYLNL